MEETTNSNEEKFSNDPEENLRLENEFLKLKMMAESGALFGGDAELPAGLENDFLKNVMAFEQQYQNSESKTVGEILGNPSFAPEASLSDAEFQNEYDRLSNLMDEKNINIDFIAPQTDRFKYNFITSELFEHETDLFPMAGMATCFIYEEFHPDHEQEITDATNQFLKDFFSKKINAETYYFSREMADVDDSILSREDFIDKINKDYEAIRVFSNPHFAIENTDVQLKEEEGEQLQGMGFGEGSVSYTIVLNNGKSKKIEGPFKIYFVREWDAWSIFSFRLAGYNLFAP